MGGSVYVSSKRMAVMSSDVLHVTNLELVLVTLAWQRDSLGHCEDPKVIP